MVHKLRKAGRLFLVVALAEGCSSTPDDGAGDGGPIGTDASDASAETAGVDVPRGTVDSPVTADVPVTADSPRSDAGADALADAPPDGASDGAPDLVPSDGAADADTGPWQPDGLPTDLRPRCMGTSEVDHFASVPAFQAAIVGLWFPCAGDFKQKWQGMPVELTADGKWYLLEPTAALERRTGPDTAGTFVLRPWPANPDGSLQAFDADFFSAPNPANNLSAPMTATQAPRILQIGDLFYTKVTRVVP